MKRTSYGVLMGVALLVCGISAVAEDRSSGGDGWGGGGSAAADDGADYLCLCGDGDDF